MQGLRGHEYLPASLNRQRSGCKDCGGAICQHDRQRSRCKDCGGTSICQHNRQRSKDCGGTMRTCTMDLNGWDVKQGVILGVQLLSQLSNVFSGTSRIRSRRGSRRGRMRVPAAWGS